MKTVVITGASSGIGQALAIQYAQQHWQVIACGRNATPLKAMQQQYKNITPLVFDINDTQAINKACEKISNIDCLILNAGTCEYIDDALNFDAALFERVITTNLISVAYLLEAMLKHMNDDGQIAFMSSSVTFLPLPRAEAYGASKAGLNYLAKSLEVSLAKSKLSISTIYPGFVKTPLTDKNDFSMPFILSAEQAASIIFTGLENRKRTITFPKKLTVLLKLLNCLPSNWWKKIAEPKQQGTNAQ